MKQNRQKAELSVNKCRVALMLSVLLLVPLCLTACISGQETRTEPMAEWQEVDVGLPETVTQVLALQRMANGSLWLVGCGFDPLVAGIWELSPDDSWTLKLDIRERLSLKDTEVLSCATVLPTGEIVCSVMAQDTEGVQSSSYQIDASGEFRQLPMSLPPFRASGENLGEDEMSVENLLFVGAMLPLKGGGLIVQDSMGRVFKYLSYSHTVEQLSFGNTGTANHVTSLVEWNGALLSTIAIESGIGGELILQTLDITTNSIVETNLQAGETVESLLNNNTPSIALTPFLSSTPADDTVFDIVVPSGIYRYAEGQLNQIADSDNTALSNPTLMVLDYVMANNSDFYLTGIERTGPGQKPFLRRYEFRQVANEPSYTLRVFALEDNADIRQAIALYKNEHTDAKVELSIGLSGEGMTFDDALRNLNNEILAGNAPDILLLDGLPLETYRQQGILLDIRDVYDEARASGQYFDNILGAFSSDDGCYALPTRFSFPSILATLEVGKDITSLPSLVSTARQQATAYPDFPVFGGMSLADCLLVISYQGIFPSRSLDTEALGEFLFELSAIAAIEQGSNGEVLGAMPTENGALGTLWPPTGLNHADWSSYIGNDACQIIVSQVSYEEYFGAIGVAKKYVQANLSFKPLTLDSTRCFIPQSIMGISAASKNPEQAKDFIRQMLSDVSQRNSQGIGLTIKPAVFHDKASETDIFVFVKPRVNIDSSSGAFVINEDNTFAGGPPNEEELSSYIELFRSLDTPVVVDFVVKTVIFEQLQRHLDGEITLDTAVDTIQQRVNLYLLE